MAESSCSTGPCIGGVRLKVVKRITRWPRQRRSNTAARDLSIPQALMRRFGHNECGIYAEVIAGGTIGAGDDVTINPPA